MRKAFALDRNAAVILQPEELKELEPPESRGLPKRSRGVTRK